MWPGLHPVTPMLLWTRGRQNSHGDGEVNQQDELILRKSHYLTAACSSADQIYRPVIFPRPMIAKRLVFSPR